jgi:iron complex outermembrane recepter protein
LAGVARPILALYYLTKKNLLSNDPNNPTGFRQVGKQSAYGVEAALGFRLAESLTIDANVAALNARSDDFTEFEDDMPVSRNGKQPPDVPELAANVWLVYAPALAWRLGAGMRFVGERFADTSDL